jgi:hypothetical protein
VQQIFELTSKNYDCKFEFFAYNSFLDSFPPQLPNTGPDINTLTATFDNCVISFAPKSTEITNKGIGVKIGDNERLDIVVTKCAPTSKLFPCMAVNDTQFIVSASNAPAGGQTELFDFTFEVNPSQDVVSEIILFPQYGEYFIAPAPPIWGTGTQIENTGGSPFIYNTVIDPALFDSGDVVTIMFQPVSVQLSTGVHCRNTIVKGVIEIP